MSNNHRFVQSLNKAHLFISYLVVMNNNGKQFPVIDSILTFKTFLVSVSIGGVR